VSGPRNQPCQVKCSTLSTPRAWAGPTKNHNPLGSPEAEPVTYARRHGAAGERQHREHHHQPAHHRPLFARSASSWTTPARALRRASSSATIAFTASKSPAVAARVKAAARASSTGSLIAHDAPESVSARFLSRSDSAGLLREACSSLPCSAFLIRWSWVRVPVDPQQSFQGVEEEEADARPEGGLRELPSYCQVMVAEYVLFAVTGPVRILHGDRE
jgi:hypothetical protein